MQQAHPCIACLSVLGTRLSKVKSCELIPGRTCTGLRTCQFKQKMQKYADTRHVIYILCITLCNAVLHQTKKVQAHTPQIDHGLKRWRPIFQQRRQPRWQPCHNFLHWEARLDFKNKFDSTNAQQSSDYLITVPGSKDEFNAAV